MSRVFAWEWNRAANPRMLWVMRCVWGLASLLIAPGLALGQSDVTGTVDTAPVVEEPGPALVVGHAGLPGGLHAPGAMMMPPGTASIATLGGFGWRSGLLGPDHRMRRGVGNLGFAFAAHRYVTVAVALDGRHDRHYGTGRDEDGWVGDPRLVLRIAKTAGNVNVGAQLGLWLPGNEAPSVSAGAISAEARALLGLRAGPGVLTLSAGFRLDNSLSSAPDRISYSAADRISLGVSEWNAVLGGVHFALPLGKAFLGLEASLDLFIGDGDTPMGATEPHAAPGPMLRAGAVAGYHLSRTMSVLAFLEAAKVPGLELSDVIANDVRLVAYEPTITGGLGFQVRFGGPTRTIVENDTKVDVVLPVTADVEGQIVDDVGQPIVGAKVNVKLRNVTGTGVTDESGNWRVEKLPIGKTVRGVTTIDDDAAEIWCGLDGKKPASQKLKLAAGANRADKLTLDPLLPPGQVRGVVRSVAKGGKPVVGATIVVEPGGLTATSGPDGTFQIDLAPGQYTLTVTAVGLREQQIDMTIEPDGVALKTIELHNK